jgi:hypothetical protein
VIRRNDAVAKGGEWVKYARFFAMLCVDIRFFDWLDFFLSLWLYSPLHKPVFCGRFVPVSKENVEYAADTNGGFKAAVCKD